MVNGLRTDRWQLLATVGVLHKTKTSSMRTLDRGLNRMELFGCSPNTPNKKSVLKKDTEQYSGKIMQAYAFRKVIIGPYRAS